LRDKKVLFKKDRENLAYQKYCDNGCFKINFVVGKNGKLHGVTRVSSKGLKYIYYLYNKSKMSVNMEVAK
jgi:phage antirepressor YoqD-like protein